MIAVESYLRTQQDLALFVTDFLTEEAGELGLATCTFGSERLIREYPAVLVSPEGTARDIHGTHTFSLMFTLNLWVYHAKLDRSHSQRTLEDLLLVSSITDKLHEDMTLGRRLIFGFITQESPGFFNRPKGEAVVGTRMVYEGRSQERFK